MPDFPVTEAFVQAVNAMQLHDEARGAIPADQWPAFFTQIAGAPSPQWVYRVDREGLTESDRTRITSAITNHVPNSTYGLSADDARIAVLAAKANLTAPETTEAIRLMLKRMVRRGPG